METYGKQNLIKKEWNNIKDRLMINKYSQAYLKQFGIGTYVPKLSKTRLWIAGLITSLCIVTPATNWLIPFSIKWGLK